MTRDLGRLLRPRSVAVIGGGNEARYVQENCSKLGFAGALWHVHPKRGPFRSVSDLPAAPDAAFIGVNRQATIGIVTALRAMGAGGAVAYASGFAEADQELGDGAGLQAALLEAAGEMPLIGPNCYGFVNYLDGAGLWPDQQGGRSVDRGVAILTQSSNIAINLTMQRRGLPIAYVGTAGNQAQLGLSDLALALLQDDRVSALGLHIEGVGDLRRFEAMASEARRRGVPVVALKVGRSQAAQTAAVSHTASLSGSSAGGTALLRRLGIAEVPSLPVFLETLKLLHITGPLPTKRVASMSCSGGEASLVADLAEGRDFAFPPLSPEQAVPLRAALGPKVALSNPLDYHTYIWNDLPAMTATYSAMMQGDLALGVVVADFPRGDRCADGDWEPVIQATRAAAESSGRAMAIASSLPETLPEATAERLARMGLVPLNGLDHGLGAIEAAAWLGQPREAPEPLVLPGEAKRASVLTEAEAKALLREVGVDCPACARASRERVAQAGAQVGFPCVLKGEGIAHKTEAGAVKIDLASEAAVLEAARAMPGDMFLVEEMVQGGVAELLLAVTRDPAHGYLLTLAAGGTLTEVLQDSASLLVPARRGEVDAALGSLKITPLLDGYRGAAPANRDAILDAAMALQAFVIAHAGRLEEVEINPLICTPSRAVAADALIHMEVT